MNTHNAGIIIVDKDLNLVEVDELYSTFVCKGDENSLISNVHPDDQHLLYEMVESVEKGEKETVCFRLLSSEETYRWIAAGCSKVSDNGDFCIRLKMQDISRIEDEEELEKYDFGTGLLNKKAITDYAREKCIDTKNSINLCVLDIDNFKQVNDTKGHLFGDEVLKEVGNIVKSVLGDGGKAGRIGGDELMLVIEKAYDKAELRNYLRSIRERVEKYYKDENDYSLITVSIGAATFPDFVDNYETLFNLADRMLYRAKSRGKNRYVIYTPEIHGTIEDGILNEHDKLVKEARPQDKTRLVMESIDGFFGHMNESIPSELNKIIAAYNLDEAYIFYKSLEKSFVGGKRVEKTSLSDGDVVSKIEERSSSLLFVKDPKFANKFNSNGICVIDRPEVQLADTEMASRFFVGNDIKHAFFYRMDSAEEGYIALYKTDELSRKIPETDVRDFAYLGKMIEIALKAR